LVAFDRNSSVAGDMVEICWEVERMK
jgi:hypothetical protein